MVVIFILFALWTNLSLAKEQNFDKNFQQGIAAYESKDYEKARSLFEAAAQEEPTNVSILTNLALTHFQKAELGYAIGYFRRALELDPDFGPAVQGLSFALTQLKVKELPHRLETYESFRQNFLQPAHLSWLLIFGAFCFFFAGWLWIRYVSQRQRAFEEETPLPHFPTPALIFTLLFVFLITLTLFKVYDFYQPRGTIVAEKVSVQSAPEEGENSLFELSQGLEVIIRQTHEGWVQVTYPGAMTGWIKKESLLKTTPEGMNW